MPVTSCAKDSKRASSTSDTAKKRPSRKSGESTAFQSVAKKNAPGDQHAAVPREHRVAPLCERREQRRETPVREQEGVVVGRGPDERDARRRERRQRGPQAGARKRTRREQAERCERHRRRPQPRIANGLEEQRDEQEPQRQVRAIHPHELAPGRAQHRSALLDRDFEAAQQLSRGREARVVLDAEHLEEDRLERRGVGVALLFLDPGERRRRAAAAATRSEARAPGAPASRDRRGSRARCGDRDGSPTRADAGGRASPWWRTSRIRRRTTRRGAPCGRARSARSRPLRAGALAAQRGALPALGSARMPRRA